MALDPLLKDYYEKRLLMMGDVAWKQLVEDVEGMIKATNDIQSCTDEKSLFFKKGELSIMNWIMTLKETSQSAYELLQEEDK
jgi:hypothetical protein